MLELVGLIDEMVEECNEKHVRRARNAASTGHVEALQRALDAELSASLAPVAAELVKVATGTEGFWLARVVSKPRAANLSFEEKRIFTDPAKLL